MAEMAARRAVAGSGPTECLEDGGRAAVADEAIAWAVFCHARSRGWYADRSPDASLLEFVGEMTYALEVSARSRDDWAHAIRTGLGCLRAVWLHGGGILHGNLATRTLTFKFPPGGPGRTPSG